MTKWNLNKSFSHLCRGPSLTNRNHEHELAHYNVCPRYLKKTHSLDHMFLRCSSVVNCLLEDISDLVDRQKRANPDIIRQYDFVWGFQ